MIFHRKNNLATILCRNNENIIIMGIYWTINGSVNNTNYHIEDVLTIYWKAVIIHIREAKIWQKMTNSLWFQRALCVRSISIFRKTLWNYSYKSFLRSRQRIWKERMRPMGWITYDVFYCAKRSCWKDGGTSNMISHARFPFMQNRP